TLKQTPPPLHQNYPPLKKTPPPHTHTPPPPPAPNTAAATPPPAPEPITQTSHVSAVSFSGVITFNARSAFGLWIPSGPGYFIFSQTRLAPLFSRSITYKNPIPLRSA